MSQIKSIENLSIYISQIKSIVLSLLCNHITIKCIDSSSTFQYLACPIRLLEEVFFDNHPFHSIIIQSFENFHQKYHGCSCKYVLYFLTTFYEQIQMIIEVDEQKQMFNDLENLIQQTRLIARNQFAENIDWNLETFQRICRYQMIYAESLYEAYLYLKHHLENLIHITQVKYSEEKCLFIPGLVLPTTNAKINGSYRTILLDGYLFEDYVHLGYNNKLKIKQISTKSSWFYLISSILDKYQIDIILCSGKIDERLKSNSSSRFFIENLSTKILRLCGENLLLNYLTDLTNEHILILNYEIYENDFSLIKMNQCGTIVQYVPIDYLIDLQHERFAHCLGRCQQIMRKQIYLSGSGVFESQLYNYLYQTNEINFSSNCFLQSLDLFCEDIRKRKDLFRENIIDDFDSKFDAWLLCIDLLKIFFQIDQIIEIVDNEQISDI